jgi:hypothetical protein
VRRFTPCVKASSWQRNSDNLGNQRHAPWHRFINGATAVFVGSSGACGGSMVEPQYSFQAHPPVVIRSLQPVGYRGHVRGVAASHGRREKKPRYERVIWYRGWIHVKASAAQIFVAADAKNH